MPSSFSAGISARHIRMLEKCTSSSPNNCLRITEWMPSAAISTWPCRSSPSSTCTVTPLSSWVKPVQCTPSRTDSEGRASARISIRSARWMLYSGAPQRCAPSSPSGDTYSSLPLRISRMSNDFGITDLAATACSRPSSRSTTEPLLAIWMPAPISESCGACSMMVASMPLWRSAMAAVRPAMPAPTIKTCMVALPCYSVLCITNECSYVVAGSVPQPPNPCQHFCLSAFDCIRQRRILTKCTR